MISRAGQPILTLGIVVATRGVVARDFPPEFITGCLDRHRQGDWGDVCEEDAEANDWSVANGERVLSSYVGPDGDTVWVITERDRSLTTMLLPSEY